MADLRATCGRALFARRRWGGRGDAAATGRRGIDDVEFPRPGGRFRRGGSNLLGRQHEAVDLRVWNVVEGVAELLVVVQDLAVDALLARRLRRRQKRRRGRGLVARGLVLGLLHFERLFNFVVELVALLLELDRALARAMRPDRRRGRDGDDARGVDQGRGLRRELAVRRERQGRPRARAPPELERLEALLPPPLVLALELRALERRRVLLGFEEIRLARPEVGERQLRRGPARGPNVAESSAGPGPPNVAETRTVGSGPRKR